MQSQRLGRRQNYATQDMDNFIVHIKSEDVYADLAGDIEKSLHTSNYEVDREKQENDGLMEDELGGRIANQRCTVI